MVVAADQARRALGDAFIPRLSVSGHGRRPVTLLDTTMELPRDIELEATNVVVRNAAAVRRRIANDPDRPVYLDLAADDLTQVAFWLVEETGDGAPSAS
jgi:hypothetical protein